MSIMRSLPILLALLAPTAACAENSYVVAVFGPPKGVPTLVVTSDCGNDYCLQQIPRDKLPLLRHEICTVVAPYIQAASIVVTVDHATYSMVCL